MPPGVLILSFIGGYIFVSSAYPTAFSTQGVIGQRLIFLAAAWGGGLLVAARILVEGSRWWFGDLITPVERVPSYVLNDHIPYFGTALLSLFLGPLCALIVNLWISLEAGLGWETPAKENALPPTRPRVDLRALFRAGRRSAMSREIRRRGDPLLRMLDEARTPILVTLKNRKFYAGWVHRRPNLHSEVKFFLMLVRISGYRESENLQLEWSNDYTALIAKFKPELLPGLDIIQDDDDDPLAPELPVVALPIGEISSVTYWEADLFPIRDAVEEEVDTSLPQRAEVSRVMTAEVTCAAVEP